jgi:hypothetical protein
MADTPAATRKQARRKTVARVGADAFSNSRLSLFQGFLANTDNERSVLSNAVDLWDNSPRFSISRARMNSLRTSDGFLKKLEIPFYYRGKNFKVVIHPASITGKDGKCISYYPSAREEIVEHALRKIAIKQQAGFFDKPNSRAGVAFSLYELQKELKEHSHSFSYDELVESLDILSSSTIDIIADDTEGKKQPMMRSAYLQSLTMVRRKDYEADATAKCVVQFHPLMTESIDRLTYRQFNYQRLMKCRSQLARWLLNQLVLKYTQASVLHAFEMRYSTVKRDSGLLDGYKLQRQAVAALDGAWEELTTLGAVGLVKKSEQRGSRSKLEDVIYRLSPTREFIFEQKAANRRQNDAEETLVDKSQPLLLKKGE